MTNKNLKSGNEYKTEGISCKFYDFEYSNNEIDDYDDTEKFLLFDTAGISGPLLIEPDEKLKMLFIYIIYNSKNIKLYIFMNCGIWTYSKLFDEIFLI